MGTPATPPVTQEPPPPQVGYFRTARFSGVFSAGLLVTDRFGIPLEFHYVAPLTPPELHRKLYGEALEEYVCDRVMRPALAARSAIRPDCFLCTFDEWGFGEPLAGVPLVAARAEPAAARTSQEGLSALTRVGQCELSMVSRLQRSIRLRFAEEDGTLQRSLADRLLLADGTMDLLEPLARLEATLRHLCGVE